MYEADDLITMLESADADLPALNCELVACEAGPPAGELVDLDWQNDPVSVKLEKIKAAFLNSKTATEVQAAASGMVIGDWLEMVVKLSKQADVGPVQITAIRIELPPAQAGSASGPIIDVEIPSASNGA